MMSKVFVTLLVCCISFASSSPLKHNLKNHHQSSHSLSHSRHPRSAAESGSEIQDSHLQSQIIESYIHPAIHQLEHDENGQCIFVKREEGIYEYTSPGGSLVSTSTSVCGLYLISEPDERIEIEFEDYFVRESSCQLGGLVSVINGWELNGQFFPGVQDHLTPKSSRYQEFCEQRPLTSYSMDQNVGLIEFRIPVRGEGFRIRVSFLPNPKPCNVVLQKPQGIYTLRNYGGKINCTASIIFPESFEILSSSIGVIPGLYNHRKPVSSTKSTGVSAITDLILPHVTSKSSSKHMESHASSKNLVEAGLIRQCQSRGSEDFVEFRGGDGLDPSLMESAGDVCGLESTPSEERVDIFCGNTAVRLVSSGNFDNSVTFAFDLLLDLKTPSLTCPTLLESL